MMSSSTKKTAALFPGHTYKPVLATKKDLMTSSQFKNNHRLHLLS